MGIGFSSTLGLRKKLAAIQSFPLAACKGPKFVGAILTLGTHFAAMIE
jgi:hypothetical protein